MSDIFISYAKQDRPQAQIFAQALKRHGWSTFWDQTIPAGKSWRDTIEKELKETRCVIVLWSRNSVESFWVREEAENARRRHILVPVLIEDDEPPLGFQSIQAASLANWDGKEPNQVFLKLIADVEALIGPPLKEAEEERKRADGECLKDEAKEQRGGISAAASWPPGPGRFGIRNSAASGARSHRFIF
jgi:TIR domain